MPDITIQVTRADYPSLQIGDTAYYSNVTNTAGFNTSSSFTKIGLVKGINNATSLDDGTETTTLTCEISSSTAPPQSGSKSFMFFTKDNKVNLSSLLGYYASVKFKNNSANPAELYSVSSEISESSK